MAVVRAAKGACSINAYVGDAKTLLAFDLKTPAARRNLAGFTIKVTPPGAQAFYIQNNLRFETPDDHSQDPAVSAFATINAPIHKFRWIHVPGSVHQGLRPAFGRYEYVVTPRYFDGNGHLTALDPGASIMVQVPVEPFKKDNLRLGFTRGYLQSQAFVRHFGADAKIKPDKADLIFDTTQISGKNAQGETFTFAEQYGWMGYTARAAIFEILDEVKADGNLSLDVFAYDLNEPDLVTALLEIGAEKRVRIILDNAALHHSETKPKPEDKFERLFKRKAGADAIKRGKFGRYAHDKVFVVSDARGPRTVLTGSTNFSVTGLYVNSNHVVMFDDRKVADVYAGVFKEAWDDNLKAGAFAKSAWATGSSTFDKAGQVATTVTFSPHAAADAQSIVDGIVDRIDDEANVKDGGSVLFAVMELDDSKSDSPIYKTLNKLHESQEIFSYGISDNPDGIVLYPIGKKSGVLVTGKPVNTQLPPPFNQVPNVGIGHQIHHKFVVCGFNGDKPVVYCGSSNLALRGEQVNGDNLLAIHDGDVATAFAIEALALVDHFDFLDRFSKAPKAKKKRAPKPEAIIQQAAVSAGLFLGTTDAWAKKFFDPNDLHSVDRRLFAR